MAMTRSLHIGFLHAIPQIGLPTELELMTLIHGMWSRLVVTTANKENFWLFSHLDALIVMGQGDFEIVHTVVKLHSDDTIGLSIVLKDILGVLFDHVDVAGQFRIVVSNDGSLTLISLHDSLQLLGRCVVLITNLIASFDVFKEGLVSLFVATARAHEIKELEDLLDTTVHLSWLSVTSAILLDAGPIALHSDARFAVEAITV